MQNNEDCASPVEVFTKKKIAIKAYSCLFCGQKGWKEELRKPQEKGIATFLNSSKLRNEYNGYNVSYFLPFRKYNPESIIGYQKRIQFAGTLKVIQRFAIQKIPRNVSKVRPIARMILKNQLHLYLSPEQQELQILSFT